MRTARVACGLAALALLASPLSAQRAPMPELGEEVGLPYFDVRYEGDQVRADVRAAVAAARDAEAVAARDAELAALREQVLELRLDDDELFGTPHFLRSTRQFLTQPLGGSFAPAEVVADYVGAHRALFEVQASEVLTARRSRDYATKHNGVTHLTFQQQIAGLDVWGAEMKANVTARGELINISSTLLPRPAGDFTLPGPNVTSAQAIALAAEYVGVPLAREPVPAGPATGANLLQAWQADPALRADTPPTTELLVFPLDRVTMHPAWKTVIAVPGVGNTYEVTVDAVNGSILRVWNRLHHLLGGNEDATYNVWTGDSPAPGSPGLTTPSNFQFPLVPRTLVTSGATPQSPQGWIPDGVNETVGNNVDAYLDLNADNNPDLPRPQGSPYRVFDFPADMNLSPADYRDAAVTQLFYYANRFHDKLYDFGFDEASPNFQDDNFGLGGVDGDAIHCEAQDGGGTNNANWNGSGSDGSYCWIQMYVFDGANPDKDGDFDGDVVYHEYAHGLSIRLSGGTVFGEQAGGMGEGWGDFFGVCMSAEPGDDPDGNYAMGGWVTEGFLGLQENYYFGIRRYPYSGDFSTSPLTYADTDPAQIVLPPGIPESPAINNSADAVHAVGEIWCNALLACRSELWTTGGLGFAANDLIMQLVVDGMKLMPSTPNLLESRDAILAADLAGFGGAHLAELWAGFAERGLGDSASSPAGSTTTGVVEAFDVPSLILFELAAGTPDQLTPSTPATFTVAVSGLGGDSPLPGTGMLHYAVNGGSFAAVPMTPTGVDTYDATLPGFSCFDEVEYFVSVDSTAGLVNEPSGAPADTFSATVYTGETVLLDDPVEATGAWVVGFAGDDATTGIWERGNPNGTAAQPEDDHTPTGTDCFFTGQGSPGGSVGENDVDGGRTTLRSPLFDLSSGDALLSYWRWYNNEAGSTPNTDVFQIDISNDGGANWTSLETVGPTGDTSGGWVLAQFQVGDVITPTGSMQLRFIASDEGDGSIVEAAIDDLKVSRLECDTTCQADLGLGGPGSLSLSLCGAPLSTGNSADLTVSGAPAFATVFLAAGATNSPVPFKGGLLVPVPIALLLDLPADAAGGLSVPIAGGGGPFSVYVQAVVPDGSQALGFALSNAIRADFEP